MSGHSIISPSSAHVWGAPGGCRGSVTMAAAYPEDDSEAAREGTTVHGIAVEMIEAATRAGIGYPPPSWVGGHAANGVIIDQDMYDAAEMYAADVAAVIQRTGVLAAPHLGIETRVSAPMIHELSEGTPDAFLYAPHTRELFIWDLKYGFGVVNVFENWQLINYAAGIMYRLGLSGIDDQNTTVIFRIVQPRAFHRDGPIREWKVNGADLRGYVNQLHAGAHEALGPNATTRSGPHCRYCPARANCVAAIDAGVSLYEAANYPLPVELNAAAIAAQYTITTRAVKHLESMAVALEEQIKSMIRGGVNVPGYRAETGYGRVTWLPAYAPGDIAALGDMLQIELRDPKVITPAQASKKGIPADIIAAYSAAPATGVKIVHDTGDKARQIFQPIT